MWPLLLLACSTPHVALEGEPAVVAEADPPSDSGDGLAPDDPPAPDPEPPPDEAAEGLPDSTLDPSDAVFDPWTIHTLDLSMEAAGWSELTSNPWAETWHEADAIFTLGESGEAETIGRIALRAFGAGSVVAGKPPLKLSLDRVVDGQSWRGLEQLKLDNSSQDPAFLNERIATRMLRDAGIPAARTGWVRLRVNGTPVGFFVLMEPIDDRFIARNFEDSTGPLYGMISGWYAQGLNPFPEPYPHPLSWFDNQTSVEGDGSELTEAARLLREGTDAEVASAIDLEQFTRVSVARSIIGGIDTFSADGNNYYLYVHRGQLVQIPWDMDADLGYPWAMGNALAVDLRAPWLASPWSWNPVTGLPYTDPVLLRHLAMGADVEAVAAELMAGPLEWSAADAEIVATAALIGPEVATDPLGSALAFQVRVANLRLFLHSRYSALTGRDIADCVEPDDGSLSLSDLSPTGTVGWGSLWLDQTAWGPGFTVNGDHFCRGLFAHSPSVVQVTVPAGISTLTGAVGLQDWNQYCGEGADFYTEQGGATLWSSGVRLNYDPALDIGELAVSPGTLYLRTHPSGNYNCDTTVWLDLRLH
jgi:hypothetical protein